MSLLQRLLFIACALCLWMVPSASYAQTLRELTWAEMIPIDAPAQPLQLTPLHIFSDQANSLSEESGPAVQQQIPNAPAVSELDQQQVKLPGYIVPLQVDLDGRVSEFLFVPYYGACIHVPPPPSNQIVHVFAETGVMLNALYQPFWIEGPLQVTESTSELANSSYRMYVDKIYPYEI